MAIDMSQFYQVFFEEAAEHLATMESLLLEIDVAAPDAEQLNAVFRAAHSIKGSAGTFGFTDLAEVTHVLENLLDRIRKGEIALRNDMIDAFLDAGDVLKGLLDAHKTGTPGDAALAEETCRQLRRLTDDEQKAPSLAVPEATVGDTDFNVSDAAEADTSSLNQFDVRFAFDDGLAGQADAIANLLAELREIATVAVSAQPSSDDPSGLWQLSVATEYDEEALRSVLEFVAKSDSLRILPMGASVGDTQGAYGFFDDEPALAPSAASTLGVSGPAGLQDDEGGAFGFFLDVPLSSDQAVPVEDEAAYGFFEPLPIPAPEDDQAGAYGFFEPLSSAPVAEGTVVERAVADVPVTPTPIAPAVLSEPPVAAVPVEREGGVKEKGESPGESRKSPPATSAKSAVATEATIRVGVEKVDQLINLIGELVITQAMLLQSASTLDPVEHERLHNGLAQLERNTRDLQESVMSIRMMPISVVFSRFPRVIRDLSQKLGKQVELKTLGEGTELDKGLIERVSDPLTHLVRNSLDHGIESPEDRLAKGKPAMGTITLKAYHQSGNIVIEVGDDGAGLDRQRILAKARERGLPTHDQMTDQEVWQLIFEPGFSTAEKVTEVSGRGVGMDVVKKNIAALGGRVEIESMSGIGTRMTVRLPLTLAILDGMSVAVGPETFIIPIGYVIESLQATRSMVKSVSGVERLLHVRDEYLPIVSLREVFNVVGGIPTFEHGIMVILEADGTKAALFVDALVGQHQVVIKSLEANYRRVPGVSGATIMGDGSVALILDVAGMVGMARALLPAAA